MSKKTPLIPPLRDAVSVEDALRAFMRVDPKKLKKAEEKAAQRKVRKRAKEG